MTDPFTRTGEVGTPTWTGATAPSTDYTVLSSTGQEQITEGGYGLGGFGDGGYGTGVTTTITINTTLTTEWTPVTDR